MQAIGIGDVEWEVLDIKNQPVILKLQCLHVPKAPCRLVSPQQLCRNDDPSKPNLNVPWIGENSNDAKVIYNGHITSFSYDDRSKLSCKSMLAGCNKYCILLVKLQRLPNL